MYTNYHKHIGGLLLFFFLALKLLAQPEERMANYELRVLGMNIGTFSINQKTEGDEIQTTGITDVKIKLIFRYHIKYFQNSLYRDGILWNSRVRTIKNGEPNSDTRLEKQQNSYLLVNDNDSTVIPNRITYSGSLLYFYEPQEVTEMYKERTGERNLIKKTGTHTYITTDDKGRDSNEYEYEGGILTHAKLKHPLATIHMILLSQ